MRFRVASTGLYAPPRVETAAEVGQRCGRSAEWVLSRTGVARRHVAEEPWEAMAAKAARVALQDRPPDLLINASASGRQLIPDSSVFVAKELGIEGIPTFSVHATCLSFLVALQQAALHLGAGLAQRALIVSCEVGTTSRDWSEPESAALLGDGAAAAVIEPSESSAMLGFAMGSWPDGALLAEYPGCGALHHPNAPDTRPEHNLFHMRGPRLYKFAIPRVGSIVSRALEQAGIGPSEVDLVVPHQASGPALEALARFGFPRDKIVDVVGEYGNCIAASIPMALATADAEGRLSRGDRILLVGTGAGVHAAAAVLRW
jgi:3-oxoacyl-[acyl-carrier-protein] synthase-3